MWQSAWEWWQRNEKNPAIGSVCWPFFTWMEYNRENYGWALFGAFWAGVAIEKYFQKLCNE